MRAELSHDILAAKIYAKASAEELALRKAEQFLQERYAFFKDQKVLLRKKDLEYLTPFLDKIPMNEAETEFVQKSKAVLSGKRMRKMIGIAVATAFVLLAVFAVFQFFRAKGAEENALIQERLAITQADSLEKGKEVLNVEKALAEEKQQSANEVFEEAEQQQSKAQIAAQLASDAAQEALEAKSLAEKNLLRAENAKVDAVRDSLKNKGLYFSSRSRQALQSGDFRLATHFADRAWNMYKDELTRKSVLGLRNSPYQMGMRHADTAEVILPGPQAKTFASSFADGTIKWNRMNGEAICVIRHQTKIIQLEMTSDEEVLLGLGEDNTIHAWDRNGKHMGQYPHLSAKGLFFTTLKDQILSIPNDHEAILWDQNGKQKQTFKHEGIDAISVAKHSSILVSRDDDDLNVWDLSGRLKTQFDLNEENSIVDWKISPQGRHLLVISGDLGAAYIDEKLSLWDILEGVKIREFQLDGEFEIKQAFFATTYEDTSYWKFDMDHDGVMQKFDRQPNTPIGAPVDSFGVALDTDLDGVIDLFDQQPENQFEKYIYYSSSFEFPLFRRYTYPQLAYVEKQNARYLEAYQDFYQTLGIQISRPEFPGRERKESYSFQIYRDKNYVSSSGFYDYRVERQAINKKYVDPYGIPIDNDRDGIVNFLDAEYNSPIGAKVDSTGKAVDTDTDQFIDFFDAEINSLGFFVDNTGIGIDADRDGVLDEKDEEQLTPPNTEVDTVGVAVDWQKKMAKLSESRKGPNLGSEEDLDGRWCCEQP